MFKKICSLLLCLLWLSTYTNATERYKITGSGMNYPAPPSWATLGVNIDSANLQDSWLRYYYPQMKLNLISTSITGVTVEDTTITITGIGRVQGNDGFTFTATINDGNPDAFGIEIRDADDMSYYKGEIKPIVKGNFLISK
jgi:hypothetical protein